MAYGIMSLYRLNEWNQTTTGYYTIHSGMEYTVILALGSEELSRGTNCHVSVRFFLTATTLMYYTTAEKAFNNFKFQFSNVDNFS